jgi:hypothetical protein
MSHRICLAIAILFAHLASSAYPCTTAVVSGRVTSDGRPLLWKNRDFWQTNNEVVYFRGEDG